METDAASTATEPPATEAPATAGRRASDSSGQEGEPPPPSPPPSPASSTDATKDMVRTLTGLLANVTAVTALLVYFGWRRSETQARELGIDESILGMSTRDYVIRSVGPVLVLLTGVAVAGLIWVWLDRHLAGWIGRHRRHRRRAVVLHGLAFAWLILPLAVITVGYAWRELAYVLFPASIGAGFLLMLYASHLRGEHHDVARTRERFTRAFVGLIVAVCLFWTASNYAEVLGNSLAEEFTEDIDRLTGVVVYSQAQLHLDAPGADEQSLSGAEGAYRYRYTGLRLLEHTGDTYFLVSDGWSPRYGVVIALPDGDATLRLEFVRDRR